MPCDALSSLTGRSKVSSLTTQEREGVLRCALTLLQPMETNRKQTLYKGITQHKHKWCVPSSSPVHTPQLHARQPTTETKHRPKPHIM